MTQTEAWQIYDGWVHDPRVLFLDEPPGLEQRLRSYSRRKTPAPKEWADDYLLAFASLSDLTFVTFDRAFHGKTRKLMLLGGIALT